MQAGSPYGFQPLTMKILGKEEDKAKWQDRDPDIKIVIGWLKEGQQPTGTEMNFQTSEVQAYRKFLSVLKLKPVEGTAKTILVKQILDRYCLLQEVASQVIWDVHFSYMHIGIDGIVQQAQKFVWIPRLYTTVRRELINCAGCMQKHKLQRDVRVEYCFYP